jgi:hypothetical protein
MAMNPMLGLSAFREWFRALRPGKIIGEIVGEFVNLICLKGQADMNRTAEEMGTERSSEELQNDHQCESQHWPKCP